MAIFNLTKLARYQTPEITRRGTVLVNPHKQTLRVDPILADYRSEITIPLNDIYFEHTSFIFPTDAELIKTSELHKSVENINQVIERFYLYQRRTCILLLVRYRTENSWVDDYINLGAINLFRVGAKLSGVIEVTRKILMDYTSYNYYYLAADDIAAKIPKFNLVKYAKREIVLWELKHTLNTLHTISHQYLDQSNVNIIQKIMDNFLYNKALYSSIDVTSVVHAEDTNGWIDTAEVFDPLQGRGSIDNTQPVSLLSYTYLIRDDYASSHVITLYDPQEWSDVACALTSINLTDFAFKTTYPYAQNPITTINQTLNRYQVFNAVNYNVTSLFSVASKNIYDLAIAFCRSQNLAIDCDFTIDVYKTFADEALIIIKRIFYPEVLCVHFDLVMTPLLSFASCTNTDSENIFRDVSLWT